MCFRTAKRNELVTTKRTNSQLANPGSLNVTKRITMLSHTCIYEVSACSKSVTLVYLYSYWTFYILDIETFTLTFTYSTCLLFPSLLAFVGTTCPNLNDLTHVLVHCDQEEWRTTKAEKRMTGEKCNKHANSKRTWEPGTYAECACKTQTVHLHYESQGGAVKLTTPTAHAHVHWITE